MIKCIIVMKIQPRICLMTDGNHENTTSQVGSNRDLNSGLPEYESTVLPLHHPAR